ncbi:MAG: prephenate dehydratase [archaeon]
MREKTIAVLGPKGSYGEIAARTYKRDIEPIFYGSHEDVILAVTKKKAKEGIVAVENMIHGTVTEVWDLIIENRLNIKEEIIIPIHLCIAAKNSNVKIKEIISHPVALEQAKKYIKRKYSGVLLTIEQSTSLAMSIAKSKDGSAAIGNLFAAKENKLFVIDKNIEDYKNNKTRFFVVGYGYSKLCHDKKYKTSIAIYCKKDMPGLLYKIITPFAKAKINLTRIESRPTKKKLGAYMFYIDFIGHFETPKVKKALDIAKKSASDINVLGSYESR